MQPVIPIASKRLLSAGILNPLQMLTKNIGRNKLTRKMKNI
jgi:hypothetical protein